MEHCIAFMLNEGTSSDILHWTIHTNHMYFHIPCPCYTYTQKQKKDAIFKTEKPFPSADSKTSQILLQHNIKYLPQNLGLTYLIAWNRKDKTLLFFCFSILLHMQLCASFICKKIKQKRVSYISRLTISCHNKITKTKINDEGYILHTVLF